MISNLTKPLQFLCIDAGGTIGATNLVEDLAKYTYNPNAHSLISSCASDCMRPHLYECIEFIAELHTINKVKVSRVQQGMTDKAKVSRVQQGRTDKVSRVHRGKTDNAKVKAGMLGQDGQGEG